MSPSAPPEVCTEAEGGAASIRRSILLEAWADKRHHETDRPTDS